MSRGRRLTPASRLLGFSAAERRRFAAQLHVWRVRHHWTDPVPATVQHRILDALMFKVSHVPGNQVTGYVDFTGGDYPSCVIRSRPAVPHKRAQSD